MRLDDARSDAMTSHIAISVPEPERAARIIADLWRGAAMPMPPSSETWIAYADDEQDSAVELYPRSDRPGARKSRRPPAVQIVLSSPLSQKRIEAIARRENALPRLSKRGPFLCVDLWIEDWLRIEVVAFAMRVDHRRPSSGPSSIAGLPRAAARKRAG